MPDTYKVHPIFSRRQAKRVSPLPATTATTATVANSENKPYKTIKEEAAEYKAKIRAMHDREAAGRKRGLPQKTTQTPQAKPVHPRESPLHREPSRFRGVFAEWWGYHVEIIKYHFSRIKHRAIPTLFCLRVEVDNQE